MKKFSPMRMTGATEEAAIAQVLSIVGASRDEVEFEVLENNAKGVTVRVKPRTENAAPSDSAPSNAAPSVETSAPSIETPEIAQPQAPLNESDEALESEEDDVDYAASEFEGEEDFSEELESDEFDSEIEELDEDADSEEMEQESESEESADDAETEDSDSEESENEDLAPAVAPEEIERARALAQSFLDKMGLLATCHTLDNARESGIALEIEGADIGILIGKQGATLQSFQYLLNLSFNNGVPPENGVRVTVDAGNYRARRQSSLEMTARAAAQRARASGRPVRLEPMPSSERRIIHMFLRDEAGITTQSEGREPQRRLVILPSDAAPYESRGRGFGAGNRGMGGFNRGGNRGGRGYRR